MRVAVVTGGGRGIGRAIALQLADDGFHVHIVARTPAQVEAVVTDIRERGGSACGRVLDVSDASGVETTLGGQAGACCGVPQVLVNAAGVFGPLARVADGNAQAWVNTLLTNTVGSYLTCLPFQQPVETGALDFSKGQDARPPPHGRADSLVSPRHDRGQRANYLLTENVAGRAMHGGH